MFLLCINEKKGWTWSIPLHVWRSPPSRSPFCCRWCWRPHASPGRRWRWRGGWRRARPAPHTAERVSETGVKMRLSKQDALPVPVMWSDGVASSSTLSWQEGAAVFIEASSFCIFFSDRWDTVGVSDCSMSSSEKLQKGGAVSRRCESCSFSRNGLSAASIKRKEKRWKEDKRICQQEQVTVNVQVREGRREQCRGRAETEMIYLFINNKLHTNW